MTTHLLGFHANLLLLALLAMPASAQTADIASPAIDHELFRPGEVTRSQREFGRWNIVCDEVKKLKQKFCSLRTFGFDAADQPIVGMIVSTSDNGRPAALITLPFGINLVQKITVVSNGIKGKILPVKLDLTPSLCVDDGCKFIWSLTSENIAGLRNGVDFQINFMAAKNGSASRDAYTSQHNLVPVSARIFSSGFNEAVLDSTK